MRTPVARQYSMPPTAALFLITTLSASIATGQTVAANETAIAVMPFRTNTLDPKTVRVLDNLVVAAVSELGRFDVMSPNDVEAMLGIEKMRDATGCDEIACASELAGALGSRYLYSGTLDILGSKLVLTATLLDLVEARPVRRASAEAENDPDQYAVAVRNLVAMSFDDQVEQRVAVPEELDLDASTIVSVLACLANDADACARLRDRSVRPLEAAVMACVKGEKAACDVLPSFPMPEVISGLSAACATGSKTACETLLRLEDSRAVDGLYQACIADVHHACDGLVASGRIDELRSPVLKWTGVAVMIAGAITASIGAIFWGEVVSKQTYYRNEATPPGVVALTGGGVILTGLAFYLASLVGDFRIDEVRELRDKPFLSLSVGPTPSKANVPVWTFHLSLSP